MFVEKLRPEASHFVFFKWWLMAFLAGQVNAGGFILTGRFVSHVTGFATLFGVELAHGEWNRALGMITVPLFFLLGVVISGFLVEAKYLLKEKPRFDQAMLLVLSCLLICMIESSDYITMALLCLASGLQNAAISSATQGLVKVTHLTGATTDMGLQWVKWWTLKSHDQNAKAEFKMSEFRVGLVISFALGSLFATLLFIRWREKAFIVPALFAFYAWLEARRALNASRHP